MLKQGMAIIAVVVVLLGAFFSGKIFQNVDADEIVIIQSPVSGELTWHTDPGIKWQGFGRVTVYKKRSIYEFTNKVRFNDGAHADMTGSIQYELPLDTKILTAIHVRFGSQDAVQKQLVQTVVDKATYMTGPLMSSKESYAEKRNALIWYVEDQVANGVYRTKQQDVRAIDQITGVEKTVTVVEIVQSKEGKPERQEEAVLESFKVKPFNFSITNLVYDPQVEQQITEQQKATMDVQTAMAEAKKAEQRKQTVIAEGEATAAKTQWEQEAVKAREVTKAEQEKQVAEIGAQKILEVAKLEAAAAEQTKLKEIRLGEGEATRKRLVMEADGALALKLDALVKINTSYAEAIKGYTGNWMPAVVMGNSGNAQPGSGAQTMIDLLTAHTARQLGVDLGVPGIGKTKTE